MNQLIKITLPVLTIILFTACNSGDKTGADNESGTARTQQPVKERVASTSAGVQLKDDKLNAVYPHYADLTKALINGDLAAAKIAGGAIEAGAQTVEGGENIKAAATKISAATDIEVQRAAYAALSNDMVTLIKKTGLKSGALYIDHCPMAMKDKGADWLSESKEIKNPYLGSKMMTCGEVKETLQ